MLFLLLLSAVSSISIGANILVHPESRLVAAGVEVSFICKIDNGEEPHWVINNYTVLNEYQKGVISAQHFAISEELEDTITTLTLRVNATTEKNSTEVFCLSSYKTRSGTALLLIINDSPLSPNPSIENPNSSSILLKWSPPFLWLGQAIEYYDVFITNEMGESKHSQVNATFSEAVVSFTASAAPSQRILTCEMLHFCISPVTRNQTVKLPSYTAVGGYIPNAANLTSLLDVNITVLFHQSRTPAVIVNIEILSFICGYQSFNYTIILTSIIDNQRNSTQLGPYLRTGSNTITQTITSVLQVDLKYSLVVTVNTTIATVTSDEYFFDTNFTDEPNECDAFTHKTVMGIALGIAALLILILTTTVLIKAICNHKEGNASRVRESPMVTNPVYEGAIYDSISSQQNVTTAVTALKLHTSIAVTEKNEMMNSKKSMSTFTDLGVKSQVENKHCESSAFTAEVS